MTARRAILLILFALCACSGRPPRFPTEPPPITLTKNTPPPSPAPKGVSRVEIDPGTRTRATIIVVASAAVFLLGLVFSRRVGSGIAAAYLGPVIAILIAARRFGKIFTDLAAAPFDFAGLVVVLWNENQPVLAGFYGGSIALIILMIVSMRKAQAETGNAIMIPIIIAIGTAIVSFLAFVSLTRLLIAILDPIKTDPVVQSLEFLGLGEAARAAQTRLIVAIVAAFATVILLIVSLILSFILRPVRRPVAFALFALIVMLVATWLERSWCEVLAATARAGHVPGTFLTR